MNLLEVNLAKLIKVLRCNPERGLGQEQAERNREDFVTRTSTDAKTRVKHLFSRVFGDIMVLLFIGLSLLSQIIGADRNAFICLAVMLFGYFVFISISYRYISSVYRKTDKFKPTVTVRRGGKKQRISPELLVPGDILLIGPGDRLQCDAIILKQNSLTVSSPESKYSAAVKRPYDEVTSDPNGDKNEYILYYDTVVLSGSALAFVCNVGDDIVKLPASERKLGRDGLPSAVSSAAAISKNLSLFWIVASLAIFLVGIACGQNSFGMFCYACTLVIAAMPDFIAVLSELVLAARIKRLAADGCIVKNTAICDLLGNTDCIIVNDSRYFIHSSPVPASYYRNYEPENFEKDPGGARSLITYCMLTMSNDSEEIRELCFNGKSIDRSLENAAAKIGIKRQKLERRCLTVAKFDFNPRRGFSCSLTLSDGEYTLAMRGIPEAVIERCRYIEKDGRRFEMTESIRQRIADAAHDMVLKGQYVCAVAKHISKSPTTSSITDACRDMTFAGLIGLYTPIKTRAAGAVNSCAKGGISTVLMTDDLPDVTLGLGKNVALIGEDDYSAVLTENDLQNLDRGVFIADISKYKLFQGLSSESKREVIALHRANGETVMTVSESTADIEAQRETDISVVPFTEKTTAVREGADIIITKNSFDVLPECIKAARAVYSNVVHIIQYLFSMQMNLLLAPILLLIIEKNIVLTPMALIIFGLLIILPTAASLLSDSGSRLLSETANEKGTNKLSITALAPLPCIAGASVALVSAISYKIGYFMNSASITAATSCTVITMFISSVLLAFSLRHDGNIFKKDSTVNLRLFIMVAAASAVCAALICVSPLNSMINTRPVGAASVLVSAGLCLLPLIISELIKVAVRYLRNPKGENKND